VLALACAQSNVFASEQSRPLKVIVPTPPGSASDALARALSAPWSETSKRPVVVENVVGAGTTIGVTRLVRSPSDGLTLGIISSNHTINPFLYKNLPYDAIKDITPIAMIGNVPGMLVANKQLSANNPTELAALARAATEPLAEGVVSGTAYHLAGEVFKNQANITSNRIPYKGSSQVLNDLLGGTLDFAIIAAQLAAPQVAAGKLKGLAVTTPIRTEVAPDIPTLPESGLPDYRFDVWIAVVGPAGMSDESVTLRRNEIEHALRTPDMQATLRKQGIQPITMTPHEMTSFMEKELQRNADVIKQVGISAE